MKSGQNGQEERTELPAENATISISNDLELDQASVSLFADLTKQRLIIDSIWQGALALILRQKGLQGNWAVSQDGRSLEEK